MIWFIGMAVEKESRGAFLSLFFVLLMMVCGAQSDIRQHLNDGTMIPLPSPGLVIPFFIAVEISHHYHS
ncbi:MAG: hypothetical protein ACI4OZ_01415, partial [Akkermansia sp.]